MLAFRVVVLAVMVTGAMGFHSWGFEDFPQIPEVKQCNIIPNPIGRMRLALLDNDVNNDGVVNGIDFGQDAIRYNSDDNLCAATKSEMGAYGKCRYGWSDEYNEFIFNRFDANGDQVIDSNDASGPVPPLTTQEFLKLQFNRFLLGFCAIAENFAADPDCALLQNMPKPDFMQ